MKYKLLVHLNAQHEAARQILNGILRYVSVSHRFEIQFTNRDPPFDDLNRYAGWRPDAIITDSRCHRCRPAQFAAVGGKAAVFINTDPYRGFAMPHAVFTTDDGAIGRTAAEFFLGKGCVNFAYVEDLRPRPWDIARFNAFSDSVARRGFSAKVFKCPAIRDWLAYENRLSKWLAKLDKPCAILAAYDILAKQVIDACDMGGISVPGHVQIMGVDNETYICDRCTPTLTSIALNYEAGGFQAAEFIFNALEGKEQGECRRFLFDSAGIVERISTEDSNGVMRRVSRARLFMKQHAASGIGVTDIASFLAISPRHLEKNYRAITGRTILSDLQDEKLAIAKELLRKTSIPVNNLATFCGFSSPSHLKRLFKARLGITMSAWRTGTSRLS